MSPKDQHEETDRREEDAVSHDMNRSYSEQLEEANMAKLGQVFMGDDDE